MKIPKAILSTTAAILAVGSAFADPNFDFVMSASGIKYAIPEQVLCSLTPEQERCKFISTNGICYEVFDDWACTIPKYKGMQPYGCDN